MEPRFNLINEPWIPLRKADGSIVEAGLKEALCSAHQYVALAESSPPNMVALHRLLLALLSRCVEGEEWDKAKWWRDGLPVQAIKAYFEKWKDRFWVFPRHASVHAGPGAGHRGGDQGQEKIVDAAGLGKGDGGRAAAV